MQAKWFDKEYCEFAHRWFEDAPVAAARQRLIEGEDFETVLDEELRGESSDEDEESDSIHACGLVIRDLPLLASNFRNQASLSDYLTARNVVGIAGGPEKCAYVKEVLKFDECIDYKAGNLNEDVKKACPKGIDIYFENVGGAVTKAVAPLLNNKARVPVCGFISKYNEDDMLNTETPFHVLGNLKPKPKHRFFVVHEWVDEFELATKELSNYVSEGNILYRETKTKGFENAPLYKILKNGKTKKKWRKFKK